LWDAFVDHIIKESHFLLLRVKTSPLNLLQRIFDAICSELHSEQAAMVFKIEHHHACPLFNFDQSASANERILT